jgi:DNA-binding MarR family transcriptional regulator
MVGGGDGVRDGTGDEAQEVADRLHSAAIHLLRRLRVEDAASGLTAPRLSALSVIVFGGPLTLGDLAAAEQVRPPTVSRLVRDLEQGGLVIVEPDEHDKRVRKVRATPHGRRLLFGGKRRRVERLSEDLRALTPRERHTLRQATEILERILHPGGRPGPGAR